jgi:intracellular septation protein
MADRKTEQDIDPEVSKEQLVKLLVELGPLLVFFLVNWQAGKYLDDPKQAIFWGTGTFIVATMVSLLASRILFGKLSVMPLVTGLFVVVFGGLTLWLQNDLFIKLKPTIVNSFFAAILLGGLAFGQSFLKYPFGDVFKLTEEGWRHLTVRWAMFFVVLAVLNEIVWRNFSTDTWVSFKVFGIFPLTMAFGLAQIGLLKRYEQHSNETI